MLLEKVNSDQPMTRDELRQILREIKDRLWREDTNEAFASKLCATGGAASFLVRKSVINSTWLHCVDTLLYLAPNYATQLVNAGIYTLLLGFGSEHTGAKSLREGSRHILDQLSTNQDGLDLGKIVATPGVVPFVARGIEDNWSHAISIFAKFDDVKKARTWMQLEENLARRGNWGDWGKDSSGNPVYSNAHLADLVTRDKNSWPIHPSVFPSVKDAHTQYRTKVIEVMGHAPSAASPRL